MANVKATLSLRVTDVESEHGSSCKNGERRNGERRNGERLHVRAVIKHFYLKKWTADQS